MKTMKLGGKILRVKEKDVDAYLMSGYFYAPKAEWKKTIKEEISEDKEISSKKEKIKNNIKKT